MRDGDTCGTPTARTAYGGMCGYDGAGYGGQAYGGYPSFYGSSFG